MDPVFTWLEGTALSVWLREAPTLWAFPFVLILHTWGLAFLVGANVVLDVRILGLIPGVPLQSLERYFLVMWIGFWINLGSGLALLIAYPTKALTNPLFYAKLVFVAVGFATALVIRRRLRALPAPNAPPSRRASGTGAVAPVMPMPPGLVRLAAFSLAAWAAAIPAGRFLAYTCTRLMVDSPC
jgi:hypothetical protein